LPKWRNW